MHHNNKREDLMVLGFLNWRRARMTACLIAIMTVVRSAQSQETKPAEPNPDSSLRHIEETRKYLHDFNSSMATTSTSLDLYEKMLALHPNRVNPGSLWATTKTVKPS